MRKFKSTITWRGHDEAKNARHVEAVTFTAANFSAALRLAQQHVAELPNAQLVRLETV